MVESKYYNQIWNRFNIIDSVKNREFAILPAARALKVNNTESLIKVLNLVRWDRRRLKLYCSVARVSNIPFFTFDLTKRSDDTGKWFEEQFDKEVTTYDIFLDFDCEELTEIGEVLKEVKEFTDYLNDYEVSYTVNFSGNRGFHVVIDGNYLQKPIIQEGTVINIKKIQEDIQKCFNFKFLDQRNTGVANRLKKAWYSLCLPEDAPEDINEDEMNVVLPLDDIQLKNFNLEMVKLKNVNKIRLNRRGGLERFNNRTLEEKKVSVAKFIKSISFGL